jgi:cellulose synthase/poly-beta-1,6-N-acetylglucosamine synthase-like glycosyltransferase
LLFKTKNSYFVNKQLKVINYKQINSNHSLLKINKNKNSLKLFKKYFNICNKLIRFNNKNTIIDKYPFISICIPVYNTEKYIERAALSIINQSFQNFEIVIVNDFSNDNSLNIIKRLQKEDDRMTVKPKIKSSSKF